MIGDQPPVTDDPHPGQVSGHLDAAADHRRIHRVVIGIQPDVMITRQLGGTPPPGSRGQRRQRDHRRPISDDPVRRRALQVPPEPGVNGGDPPGQLGVEIGRRRELAPGQERPFQGVVEPLHQPLRFRVPGPADIHAGGHRAAERLALRGQLAAPPAPPADRALARSRPTSPRTGPPRAARAPAAPRPHREYPHTIVSTGSCFADRTFPNPAGTCTGGNQKSHCAISPAAYTVRDAGSGGRYAGRSSATRPLSVRIEYGQPTRSAITVAGDRPSSRLNQPHRQRTGQPVTGAGRRPHHHGIGTDALSHAAQLSEGVAAGGDEGDGNAQLPEDLLNPAARFLSRLPGEPRGQRGHLPPAPPNAGQRKQRSPWPLADAPGQPHTSQPAPRSPIHRRRRESTWGRRFLVQTGIFT